MAYFFNIRRQQTIHLLIFIILFKTTLQQVLDPLKEPKNLVDQATSFFDKVKEGNFDAKLATEWMQKNAIGILCNGKFELEMGENLNKLQNEFCKSFENKNFQNLKEIFQKTKIEKKAFDKRQIDKATEQDQILNENNKGMFKRLLNNSSNLIKIHENLIEAKKVAVFQQKPNGLMGRRKKRADGNAIKGCIAGVLLTVLSMPYLGYYSNKYAHEGNVQVVVTTYCHQRPFYCYHGHNSVVTIIVEWTILLAIGLIFALLFCSCVH